MSLFRQPPAPVLLLPLLLLLLFLPLPTHSSRPNSPFSGEYDCSIPPVKQREPGCLSRLNSHPTDYAPCKSSTCYIFLKEPPFIILPPGDQFFTIDNLTSQTPFPCEQFSTQHPGLSGIALNLHAATSSRSNLCMWAGHANHCTFNELVSFTREKAADGYRFAITGLLLETPDRQCHHEASAAIVDNSVIIIGPRKPRTVESPWNQLISPFHWGAWLVFLGVTLLFLTTAIIIGTYGFRHRTGHSSIITAFFIFTGSRSDAMSQDLDRASSKRPRAAVGGLRDAVGGISGANRRRRRLRRGWSAATRSTQAMRRALSFSTHYQLAMKLYRIAIVAILSIFILFYEVAVVNVLFQQQQSVLEKSVQQLTDAELRDYAVLKDSALENVWQETVGRADILPEAIPWRRCPTASQCIEMANNGSVKFVVTFEVVGKYLLKELSSCEKLAIYHTKDTLFQFNGGWLYNDQVADEDRKLVDRELIALRANGTTAKFIDDAIGDFSCRTDEPPYIGTMIILVPCLIFVVPPLLTAVLVLTCLRAGGGAGDGEEDEMDLEDPSQSVDSVTKGNVGSKMASYLDSSDSLSQDKDGLDTASSSISSSLAIFRR